MILTAREARGYQGRISDLLDEMINQLAEHESKVEELKAEIDELQKRVLELEND